MRRAHIFLLAAVLGSIVLFAGAGSASAYWRLGGYHPAYGAYHGYHPYYNSYYHPYHNYYYHPYYSRGLYPYTYPVAYPYYVNTLGVAPPSNPDVTDFTSFAGTAPAVSSYVQFPGAGSTPAAARDTATIHVIVPDPNAVVLLNGQPTTSTGTTRLFVTPPLALGRENYYQVEVTWNRAGRPVTETRKIYVAPGQSQVVDFTRPASPGSTG